MQSTTSNIEIEEIEFQVRYSYNKSKSEGITVELEKLEFHFLGSNVDLLPSLTFDQQSKIIEQIVNEISD